MDKVVFICGVLNVDKCNRLRESVLFIFLESVYVFEESGFDWYCVSILEGLFLDLEVIFFEYKNGKLRI